MIKLSRTFIVGASAVLVALLLLPVVAAQLDQSFYVGLVARVLIFAIAASALNLVFGFGGLVSLGHALFIGLGAYSVAIPAFHGIGNGFAHLAIAVVACAVAGALIGAVSLRTKGMGFIMITLAFAQMGYFAFTSLKHYGGDDGTPVALASKLGPLDLGQAWQLYYSALAVLVASLVGLYRIRHSSFGMILRGARQSERRASAIGFDVWRVQWLAYVISAVICGVAGVLFANLNAFASPAVMSWFVSAELIVMVVLGGVGTVLGPVVGAAAYIGVEESAKSLTEHWAAFFGLAVIAVAVAGRKGILGAIVSGLNARKAPVQEVET